MNFDAQMHYNGESLNKGISSMERQPESFVDENTAANGTLKTDGNVRINGILEGQVISKGQTVIGKSGRIRGKVESKQAIIEGSVHGTIEAGEKIIISNSSSVKSNVVAPQLVVQVGARLQGYFVITPNQTEREQLKQNLNTDYTKPIPQTVPYSVRLPDAGQVKIVGSFTDWDENKAIPLQKTNNGLWSAKLNLKPGRYEYLLLIDGDPQPDPDNTEKIKNNYGGENSILTVMEE